MRRHGRWPSARSSRLSGGTLAGVVEREPRDRMSAMRCRRSFSRQRRISVRTDAGTSAGSAAQSGSRSRTRPACPTPSRRRNARPAGQHLVEHAAERPDVRALVDRLAARLLGTHVGGRAEDHAGLASHARRDRRRARSRRHAAPLAASSAFASPKSSTFTVPSVANLDVRRLQVAMDDALLVRRFERLGDLLRDRQRLVERNRRPARSDRRASAPSTSSITKRVHGRRRPRGRGSARCADD